MSGLRKIESQIKEIVGEELDLLSDPRIRGMVTVTGVTLSPDLSHATIYYSRLQTGDEGEVRDGLQSATGRLQARINERTHLRRTPRLTFEPDPATERATRIDSILREVRDSGE